jgi:hypothetical protein
MRDFATADLYRGYPENSIEPGVYDVTVNLGEGTMPVRLGRQRIGPGPTRLRVRRSYGARVEGVVLSPDGAPLAGVSVRGGPPGWPQGAREVGPFQADADVQWTKTDEEGTFVLSGLADGEVEVVLRAMTGSAPVVEISRRLEVSSSRPSRLDVRMAIGGNLRITLKDGASLREGFEVTLTGPGEEVRTVKRTARQVADERNGRGGQHYPWQMDGLAAGRHRVDLVWDGVPQPPTEAEIRPFETSLLLIPPR